MTTYVMVHGGWGGAHGWRLVRPRLWAAGHAVFTPSLTGIGERSHLTGPQIDLWTHVSDVVNAVLYEDLSEIVLVGYSYGGMVVTGALDALAERIAHLVYLDAFVPRDGQTLEELRGRPFEVPLIGPGSEWRVPPPERSLDDPEQQAWARARRVDHPIRCFTEPVRLRAPLESHPFTLTYIKATGEPRPAQGDAFWQAADHAGRSPAWRLREIETNHMVAENRPAELTELLLELAAPPA
jgi:pimeloyl-ACP methyl ester carboxylesterase